MPDPASRQAALVAAAMLVGPSIPPALVVNRPHEAATALTRMADLLMPWLEDGTTAQPGEAATADRDPGTGGTQHDRSERPSP